MNFTPEHIEILEKHREHWTSLNEAGFMRNIDPPVFDALQKVHNEAIGVHHFTRWCGECVAEMVKIVYGHYERSGLSELPGVNTADVRPSSPQLVKPTLTNRRKRHGK